MKRSTASTLLLLFCCLSFLPVKGIAQTASESLEGALLELKDYSVYVNRKPVAVNVGSLGGKVLWFCLPDQGQFIISTTPHKGYDFKKVGTIRGNVISFSHNGSYYEWVSISPIVGSGAEKELWLMVASNFITKECAGGVCFGGASPFEALLSTK